MSTEPVVDTNRPPQQPAETAAAESSAAPASPTSDSTPSGLWARLRASGRRQHTYGRILIGVLCAALGFAAVTQTRLSEEDVLQQARRSDLVQILDGLTQRNDRLREQLTDLQSTRRELLNSADQGETALEQAQERALELGVLVGTDPATGPGIVMTLVDPGQDVRGSLVLSIIQELRSAGAEVLQIDGSNETSVRVVADTWFGDGEEGVVVDGADLAPPYVIKAIGAPAMAAAMAVPGGVVSQVTDEGGRAEVDEVDEVRIDATRALEQPQHATPVPQG
jgi:uncharacterized protein YlxW (UPF0749 family)